MAGSSRLDPVRDALLWRDGDPAFPISIADGFWSRLRGIGGARPGTGLLLAGKSIHTFSVGFPLSVSALDRMGRVRETRVVPRARVAHFPGASFLLELPPSLEAPAPGSKLELTHV